MTTTMNYKVGFELMRMIDDKRREFIADVNMKHRIGDLREYITYIPIDLVVMEQLRQLVEKMKEEKATGAANETRGTAN